MSTHRTLSLIPQPLTFEILQELEKRELIRLLRPPVTIDEEPHKDSDQELYVGKPQFGSHMMLCVRKNETKITLYAHSDNEDVLFLNPELRDFKPLFLIIALHKQRELVRKAALGELCAQDVLALEVPFNAPRTAVFTILAGTPHCEVTTPGEAAEAPIFYVTEPSTLDMYEVDVAGTEFRLEERTRQSS